MERELDPTGAVVSRDDRLPGSSRGWAEAEVCATEADEIWRPRKGLLVRNCSGEGVFLVLLLLARDVGDRKEAPLNPNRDCYTISSFIFPYLIFRYLYSPVEILIASEHRDGSSPTERC